MVFRVRNKDGLFNYVSTVFLIMRFNTPPGSCGDGFANSTLNYGLVPPTYDSEGDN